MATEIAFGSADDVIDETGATGTFDGSFGDHILARSEDFVVFGNITAANACSLYLLEYNDTDWADTPVLLHTCDAETTDPASISVSIIQVSPLAAVPSTNYSYIFAIGEKSVSTSAGRVTIIGRDIQATPAYDVICTISGAASSSFGSSVCLTADYLYVGAEDDNSGTGQAYSFARDSGKYTYGGADGATTLALASATKETITYTSNLSSGDKFGSYIHYTNDALFVGASAANTNTGRVYVYQAPLGVVSDPDGTPTAPRIYTGSSGMNAGTLHRTAVIYDSTGSEFVLFVSTGSGEVAVQTIADTLGGSDDFEDAATAALSTVASGYTVTSSFGDWIDANQETHWIIVGAPSYDSPGTDAGAAFLFNYAGASSGCLLYNVLLGATGYELGTSVATNGLEAFVSVPGYGTAGAVAVFSFEVCVAPDTLVLCEQGEYKKVSEVSRGTKVWTRDNGYQPIARVVRIPGHRNTQLATFEKDALAESVPFKPLHITYGHPVVFRDTFVDPAEFVRHPEFTGAHAMNPKDTPKDLITLQFESHEVLNFNGVLSTSLPPYTSYRQQHLPKELYFDQSKFDEKNIGKNYPPFMLHDDPLPPHSLERALEQ